MAWHRLGEKPLSKPMIQVSEAYVWYLVKQTITSSSQTWNFDCGYCTSRHVVTHPSRTIEFQVQNLLAWYLLIFIFNPTPAPEWWLLNRFQYKLFCNDWWRWIHNYFFIYICCNGFNGLIHIWKCITCAKRWLGEPSNHMIKLRFNI